jgi:O-antigen ligase
MNRSSPGPRRWFDETVARVRRQPALALSAAIAALAALGFVVLGAAPAEQLGSGLGRFAPVGAAVLAALVAGLLVLSPWEGLLAWLVLMPVLLIAHAQVYLGPLQLTLSTVQIAALGLGLLAEARTRSSEASGDGAWLGAGRLRWAWPVASAIAILAIASAIASPDPNGGVSIAVHGLVEPAALAAIVIALRPDSRRLIWLAAAMGTSVAVASVYSLSRVGKLATTLAQVEASRVDLARLTYYNVGIYGDMLAMALPLLVVLLIARRRLGLPGWATAALALGLLVCLVGLYVTFSKSAWIGSVVAIAAVFLLVVRTWRARLVVAVVGLVVAAVFVPYPVYVARLFGQTVSADNPYLGIISSVTGTRNLSWNPDTGEGEVSIGERLLATQAGLRMAADHPLLGVGPGRFGVEYQTPTYHAAAATRALGSAHDFLPDVAAEFGLPMVVLIVLALAAAGLTALRVAIRGVGLERFAAIGFGASLLAFLVVGLTFGVDLYRVYRVMNADVLFAALLVAACVSLAVSRPAAAAPEGSGA